MPSRNNNRAATNLLAPICRRPTPEQTAHHTHNHLEELPMQAHTPPGGKQTREPISARLCLCDTLLLGLCLKLRLRLCLCLGGITAAHKTLFRADEQCSRLYLPHHKVFSASAYPSLVGFFVGQMVD
jgi:hypothetical protein